MAGFDDLIRIGRVVSAHPEFHRVRVVFDDKDGMVSNELPVLTSGSLKNKVQALPDIGETVACIFLPSGEEEGYVVGSVYSEADKPLSADKEEYIYKLPGGACLSVHRKNHTVQLIDYHGSKIVMANGDITIKSAANIYLNPDGDVSIPAHVSAQFD